MQSLCSMLHINTTRRLAVSLATLLVAACETRGDGIDNQDEPQDQEREMVPTMVVSDSAQAVPVPIPWRFEKSNYIQVNGVGDLEESRNLLAPFGYHPIDLGNNLALWSIFGVEHRKGNLENGRGGGYNEVFITVAASRDPDVSPAIIPSIVTSPDVPEEFGFFVVKIWVDDEAAKVGGNEVWGFNKDLAQIDLALDPVDGRVGFALTDPATSETIISTYLDPPTEKGVADLQFYVITRFKRATAKFTGNGQATSMTLPGEKAGDASIRASLQQHGLGSADEAGRFQGDRGEPDPERGPAGRSARGRSDAAPVVDARLVREQVASVGRVGSVGEPAQVLLEQRAGLARATAVELEPRVSVQGRCCPSAASAGQTA